MEKCKSIKVSTTVTKRGAYPKIVVTDVYSSEELEVFKEKGNNLYDYYNNYLLKSKYGGDIQKEFYDFKNKIIHMIMKSEDLEELKTDVLKLVKNEK